MYFFARSARVCASLAALGSFLSANPTIAIRIACSCGDASALARHDRAAVGRARDRRRLIGLLGDRDVGCASCGAALAIVNFRSDGIAAFSEARRIETCIRASAFHGAA